MVSINIHSFWSRCSRVFLMGAIALSMGGLLVFAGCSKNGGSAQSGELLMTIQWPASSTEKSEKPVLESAKIFRGDYDTVRNEFTSKLRFENEDQKKEALKNPMISAQVEQMTLNKLIFLTLVKHDAKKENITVSDEEIKKFKSEHLKSIGGTMSFKKILESEHITENEFDQNLKDELLIKKFVESRSTFQPVREAEARQWYNTNPQFFDLKERIKASHILLKFIESNVQQEKEKSARDNPVANAFRTFGQEPKVNADEVSAQVESERKQVLEKTQQLLAQLKKGTLSFEDAARKNSEDYASGVFGGKLDYLYQATTAPSFWNAAMTVVKDNKAGKKPFPFLIAEPVKSVFGYHIIRVEDYKKAGVQSFAEAKEDITQLLEQQRKQQLLLDWVNNKRKAVSIEFEDAYEKKDLFKDAFGNKSKAALSPEHVGVIGQPAGAVTPEEKPYQNTAKSKG